jgi:two-component system nitrogen regulation response regulator GlnG
MSAKETLIKNPWENIKNLISIIVDEEISKIDLIEVEEGNLYSEIIDEFEKDFLEKIYRQLGKNQLKTAKILGINRNTLRSKLDKYGLS